MKIALARWRDFQHYKDRDVPWVKLYAKMLDKPAYRRLDDAAARLLFDLFMMAGATKDGVLSISLPDLCYRVRKQSRLILDSLYTLSTAMDEDGKPQWLKLSGDDLPPPGAIPPSHQDLAAESNGQSRLSLDKVYTESSTEREERRGERETTPPTPLQNGGLPARAEPWKAQAARLAAQLSADRADLAAAGKLTLSYFNASMGTHFRWGSKVEQKILARLRECRSASMLFFTIDGALKDDTIMGRRADSPPDGYKRISTVFRDAEQVDRFFALSRAKRDEMHPTLAEFLAQPDAPA